MKDLNEIMPLVDQYTPCDGKLIIHRMINDGHEDEWSSNYLISNMKPVAWLGVDTTPSDMHEYLAMLGLTPAVSKNVIYDAYERAKTIGNEHGISAPKLNANEWDCYWCLAMMLSDYWATHLGDLDTASMLAYEYLSDPDR